MKKIILASFALCIAVLPAKAVDLNVSYAGSASSDDNPVAIAGGDDLKELVAGTTVCDNYAKIDDPDNSWWVVAADETYDYMIFLFNRPSGYDEGTGRWRIGGTGNAVTLYRWDYDLGTPPGRFVVIDTNEGDDPPVMEEVDIPAGWFSPSHLLVLMAVVDEDPEEDFMKCDVMDIQFAVRF
jgi:hypothetical protein